LNRIFWARSAERIGFVGYGKLTLAPRVGRVSIPAAGLRGAQASRTLPGEQNDGNRRQDAEHEEAQQNQHRRTPAHGGRAQPVGPGALLHAGA